MASILRPVEDALVFVASNPVHNAIFPFAWAPTLHATRISLVYQANAKRSSASLSWPTYIAGYLIMSWGGMFISHFLLSTPAPALYSFQPYINYLTPHLLLTAFFHAFPSLLISYAANPAPLDTLLVPVDALLRANAVAMTLGHVSPSSATDERLKFSPLFHLILGAVASAGGGVSAATLGTWTANWAVSTPVFLRSDAGLLGTLDVWGGALVAAAIGCLTRHRAFVDVLPDTTIYHPLEARAVGVLIFGVLFGIRVWRGKVARNNTLGANRTKEAVEKKKQ